MKRVPAGLVTLRAVLGPAIVAACLGGRSRYWLLGMLVAAFLSDIFDGVLARRLGVATAGLRLADSVVDIFFYFCVGVACLVAFPGVWREHHAGILLVAGLEAGRWGFDLAKYGKIAAYHMWSAKLWGILLFLGCGEVFLRGAPRALFTAMIAVGIYNEVEGLLASLLLPAWHHDVPSLWHAWVLRRAGRP
jgi:CDP-diacylglycerol--glycerol-3-phosphate 3-phosphatidyltransferase